MVCTSEWFAVWQDVLLSQAFSALLAPLGDVRWAEIGRRLEGRANQVHACPGYMLQPASSLQHQPVLRTPFRLHGSGARNPDTSGLASTLPF